MPTSDPSVLLPMVNNLLRHSPMGPEAQEALLALPVSVRTAARSDYLVRQREAAPDCMIILDGFVHSSKTSGDAARQILSFHMRGDIINLHGTLLDYAGYNVQALSAVLVGYIRFSALMRTAIAYPAIASALWRSASIDTSVSLEWMLNVGRRNARGRIAHLICELAVRQQVSGISNGPTYHWPLTQVEVADATGLTNVHVNRRLVELQREQLVRLDSRSMTIMDWTSLCSAADFNETYLHQTSLDTRIRAVGQPFDQSFSLELTEVKPVVPTRRHSIR